jgi:hypothetical protein
MANAFLTNLDALFDQAEFSLMLFLATVVILPQNFLQHR